MKLQHEANAHINKKQNKFNKEFTACIKPLRDTLTLNLNNTAELENALEHLIEVELWTRRSVELWGVKS
tara:strand:+ start:1382 stop:1588 length:207 start_codon:yes stop_codon:yes gene_type:complete